jgi:hypothetical protein
MEGAAARGAAQKLFEAGGREVLPAAVQQWVRGTVESQACLVTGWEAGRQLVVSTGVAAERGITRVAAQTVAGAGRQILRGVGAAAGAGALIDGGWALLGAARGVRSGSMTRREAVWHVVREAASGAAATAAGTAAAAALVTLTGGVAAPALFVVGAAASLGAKTGLDAWLKGRGKGLVRVEAGAA